MDNILLRKKLLNTGPESGKSAATHQEPGGPSMILEGPIARVTFKLAVPVLISMFVTFLYNIIDTFFISLIDRQSTALISGISLVTPIFYFITALSSGLRIGISAIVARCIGEKNHCKLESCFSSGLVIAVLLSLFTIGLGYMFYDDLIRLIAGKGLTKEAIQAGTDFFIYLLPGFGLLLLGMAFMGIIWGEGRIRAVGTMMIFSSVINCLLDPLFIFTFKMGVAGAALATTISIAFTGIFMFYYIFCKNLITPIHFKKSLVSKSVILEIGRISLSQAFSMLSLSLASIILNHLISSIGQQEMNSWGLCNRLEQFIFIPLFSISGANLILIGQNYGARNYERTRKIYHCSIFYSIICLLVLAVIYIIGAPVFFKLFSDVQEVIDGSVLQVRMVSLFLIGEAIEIISTSTFQGMGRAVPAFLLTFIRLFCFIIPSSYLAVYLLHFGMKGIFYSLCFAYFSVAIIAFLWVEWHFKKINTCYIG